MFPFSPIFPIRKENVGEEDGVISFNHTSNFLQMLLFV